MFALLIETFARSPDNGYRKELLLADRRSDLILLAKERTDSNRNVVKFYDWSFQNGDAKAKELIYVPLPQSLKNKIRGYWKANDIH